MGILFQTIFEPILIFSICAAMLSLICSLWKKEFLFFVIACFSIINTALHIPLKTTEQGLDLLFVGVVVAEDHRENYLKLSMDIKKVLLKNNTIDYHMPVDFYTFKKETYLGRTLLVKGRIHASTSAHRPNVLTGEIIEQTFETSLVNRIFFQIRNYIDNLFKSFFDERNYDLASGLVLGGSSRVGKELQNVFTRAGVLHILSVSGLHVGFVISFVGLILFFVPITQKIKFIVVMLVLFMYAGITGFLPTVLRAGLMAGLFGAALVFQRNVDGLHILNITALILLIINPLILFDLSAQLSFASVYGILWLYPKLESVWIKKIKSRVLRFVVSMMAISFSAQLFVSPLVIQYFHRVQTLAVFSNILIVPLTSIITYLLFFGMFFGIIFMPLVKAAAFLTSLLLDLMVGISNFFATIPFSSINLSISPIFLLLFFFLFVARFRKMAIYAILVMALLFSIAQISRCATIRISQDSILITLPNNKNILVTSKRNTHLLWTQEIEKVDYLIDSDRFYPDSISRSSVCKEFFALPEGLHYKNIRLGEIIIELNQGTSIKYRNGIIRPVEHLPEQGKLTYLITNGKDYYIFDGVLYGSVIDQLITEIKILFAEIKLLF